MTRAAAVALAFLAAGCLSAPAPPAPSGAGDWRLGGTFTTERTDATIEAWCEVARAYGNECALMESFPEQFLLRFGTGEDCAAARAELDAIEHVVVRDCARA